MGPLFKLFLGLFCALAAYPLGATARPRPEKEAWQLSRSRPGPCGKQLLRPSLDRYHLVYGELRGAAVKLTLSAAKDAEAEVLLRAGQSALDKGDMGAAGAHAKMALLVRPSRELMKKAKVLYLAYHRQLAQEAKESVRNDGLRTAFPGIKKGAPLSAREGSYRQYSVESHGSEQNWIGGCNYYGDVLRDFYQLSASTDAMERYAEAAELRNRGSNILVWALAIGLGGGFATGVIVRDTARGGSNGADDLGGFFAGAAGALGGLALSSLFAVPYKISTSKRSEQLYMDAALAHNKSLLERLSLQVEPSRDSMKGSLELKF